MYRAYAHRLAKHGYPKPIYVNFGELWWVEMHGLAKPIVQVEMTEDPAGEYLGWVPDYCDSTRAAVPELVQPEYLFELQFPYGSKAEVEHGHGHVVRLVMKEVDE
jgi:hypothetical protein